MALFEADRLAIREHGRVAASVLSVHELLQRRPMLTIQSAAKELKLSVPTVGKSLELMASAGLVREVTGKQRGPVVRLHEIPCAAGQRHRTTPSLSSPKIARKDDDSDRDVFIAMFANL